MLRLRFFLTLTAVVLQLSNSCGQWTQVYADSSYHIGAIFCLNADTCIVNLYKSIPVVTKNIKTDNGGISWDTIPENNLYYFYFINDTNGFAIGKDSVYRTFDSGNTWIGYPAPCPDFVSGLMHAFNSDTAVFASTCNYPPITRDIFLTTNGGVTLSPLPLSYSCAQNAVSPITDFEFINDSTGFASAAEECIYKTTDRGFTWNKIHENCNNSMSTGIWSISFYNDSIGWLGGSCANYSYNLKYTIDGGYTWNEYLPFPVNFCQAVKFFADGTGYFASGSEIYKTTNYGLTFNLNYSSGITSNGIRQFFFLDSQTGYVTLDHTIIKTTNGGGVGIQETNSYSFLNIYPNPTHGIITLNKFPTVTSTLSIKVFDSLSRLVYESDKINSNKTEVDLSEFPNGVYFIKAVAGKLVSTSKVILAK